MALFNGNESDLLSCVIKHGYPWTKVCWGNSHLTKWVFFQKAMSDYPKVSRIPWPFFFLADFFWAIHQPIPSDHTLQRFSLRTLPLCPPEFFRQLVPCSVASSAAKLILPFVCHCNMPHCIFMCRHITYNIYIYIYVPLSLSIAISKSHYMSLSVYIWI